MYQQLTPEEQQQLYIQKQMRQYAQFDKFNKENQYLAHQQDQYAMYSEGRPYISPATKVREVQEISASISGYPQDERSSFKERAAENQVFSEEEEYEQDIENHSSYKSQTAGPQSRVSTDQFDKSSKDDNFKVIIRIRPPLPREQHTSVPFRSILHISPDNKNVSLMEYMGAEVDELERQHDIQENPQL